MLRKIALVLSKALNVTNAEILVDIITSFLTVPGAITTRSLARYSDRSERSWFRFLAEDYDWIKARVALFLKFSHDENATYFLAFDETMEGKVGKSTHGIGHFYNSIIKIAERGIGFGACSLVNVQTGVSYFIGLLQIVRTEADKARTVAQKAQQKKTAAARKKGEPVPEKKPVGRKKGSKNKPKSVENVVETPSFRTFKALFTNSVQEIRETMPKIKLQHIIGDNAYATLQYLNLAQSLNLFLLSKLKRNSVLCLPYEPTLSPNQANQKPKRGVKRTYGDPIDNGNPPAHSLKATVIKDNIRQEYFQFMGYAKGCFLKLKINILLVRATDLTTQKVSVLVFFTNDPALTYQQIWDYYHLRFQIEFDFRDAKQHFGLSDFKNYTQKNVTNFVNLSFLMVLVSQISLPEYRTETQKEKLSINDLKTIFNARFNIKSFYIYAVNDLTSIFNLDNIAKFVPNHIINAA